jgi:hypothetical protein
VDCCSVVVAVAVADADADAAVTEPFLSTYERKFLPEY